MANLEKEREGRACSFAVPSKRPRRLGSSIGRLFDSFVLTWQQPGSKGRIQSDKAEISNAFDLGTGVEGGECRNLTLLIEM